MAPSGSEMSRSSLVPVQVSPTGIRASGHRYATPPDVAITPDTLTAESSRVSRFSRGPDTVRHTSASASRVNERPNSLRLSQLIVESNCFFSLLHMHGNVLVL